MARMNTSGLDALIGDMQKMGQQIGPMADAMVSAAMADIRDCWVESAEEHEHIDTRAMIESIGTSHPPVHLGDAVMNEVSPQGKDKSGTRNAEKAFILNFGSSMIKPSHWVDEAEAKAGGVVQNTLEDMWGKFIESGGVVPPVVDTGGLVHHEH